MLEGSLLRVAVRTGEITVDTYSSTNIKANFNNTKNVVQVVPVPAGDGWYKNNLSHSARCCPFSQMVFVLYGSPDPLSTF